MDKLEVARAKELRGLIIENLYESLGEPMSLTMLRTNLRYKAYNSERDIKRALDYLAGEGKDYIKVNVDEDNYWASSVRLTPKGVDLMEDGEGETGVMLNG